MTSQFLLTNIPSTFVQGTSELPPRIEQVNPSHLLLSLPIVNKSNLQDLRPLRNDDPPRIVPLAIYDSKPPDLIPRPALLIILHIALDMKFPRRTSFLLVALKPSILQVAILDSIQVQPS